MPGKTSTIKLDGAFARGDSASGRSGLLPGGWWLWCLMGLASGPGIWIGGRHYLRNELSLRLTSSASEQEAIASIDALMRLDGDAAVDVARALAHPDFIVAHAAFRALSEQLDAWRQLELAERTERMTQLVSELERVPLGCDQDHRILVTGLASRLYADALPNREKIAGELLERCRRIMDRKAPATDASSLANLQSSLAAGEALAPIERSLRDDAVGEAAAPAPLPPIESSTRSHTSAEPPARFSRQTQSPPAQSPPAQSPGLLASEMPRLSSNRSSPDGLESPASLSGTARVQLTGSPSRPAALLESPPALRLSDSEAAAQEQTLRAARPFDASGEDAHAVSTADAIEAADGSSSAEESRGDAETLAGIEKLSIDQLVRLLASLQPRVSQAAALALRGKGMNDEKLDLAMQLAVGSSTERMNILQSLGQRSDLDPRPWLLWMAADGDLAVREQAIGMLSPLLDQEVRRQLRLLLNQERDERVAQTIRRVLVQ